MDCVFILSCENGIVFVVIVENVFVEVVCGGCIVVVDLVIMMVGVWMLVFVFYDWIEFFECCFDVNVLDGGMFDVMVMIVLWVLVWICGWS